MFACLYSLSAPVATLTRIAEDFTPRFEVVGPLVMLDISGLSRLFGSPREIGEQLRRASGAVRIALAPTQTAAALLALGRAGLTVVLPGDAREALASLPVTLLGDFDRLRLAPTRNVARNVARDFSPAAVAAVATFPANGGGPALQPPHVAEMHDALPYFHASLERASDAARAAHSYGGGWKHPRDSHLAQGLRLQPPGPSGSAPGRRHQIRGAAEIQALLDTLRRWGITTCGALAALPAGDVYERLGARGVSWQRLAGGDDTSPLVPWVPEDPFEGALDLEWPIEGLEPLSFVLGRLLEPLVERLERADRGAAVLHTHLRLVSKDVHARTLQLPAPMRDPKTLRMLMLLDLESHPPAAAIDRVQVLIEPTPARVTQWMLFERAQPSAEQVSTLLARLTALMGDTHVGSPRLVDSWKPGVFAMTPFVVSASAVKSGGDGHVSPSSALRRFRLPVPARVQVHEGRPVRVMTDRRGVTGGAIVQAAGPWRTSGEWWNDGAPHLPPPSPPSYPAPHLSPPAHPAPHPSHPPCWDRDEWDVALADGTVYRVFVERDVGQWFIEGVVD
jgi:protein ImuB